MITGGPTAVKGAGTVARVCSPSGHGGKPTGAQLRSLGAASTIEAGLERAERVFFQAAGGPAQSGRSARSALLAALPGPSGETAEVIMLRDANQTSA